MTSTFKITQDGKVYIITFLLVGKYPIDGNFGIEDVNGIIYNSPIGILNDGLEYAPVSPPKKIYINMNYEKSANNEHINIFIGNDLTVNNLQRYSTDGITNVDFSILEGGINFDFYYIPNRNASFKGTIGKFIIGGVTYSNVSFEVNITYQ